MNRTRLIVSVPFVVLPFLVLWFLTGRGGAHTGLHAFAVADTLGLIGIAVGALRHRPAFVAPWVCLALVGLCQVAGDVAVTSGGLIENAGLLFLPRYPLLVLALLLWSRRRYPGRDVATWIDLTIVAVGLGLLSWVFLLSPQFTPGEHLGWTTGTTLGYPAIQLLVIALGLRLWLGAPRRSPAMFLLGCVLLVYLTAEVLYSLLTVSGQAAAADLWNVVFLLPGPLTAAAALHPSMARLADRVPETSGSVSGHRLVVLAVVAAVPPGVLIVQHVRGADPHVPSVAAACLVLTSLVLTRMWLLVVEQRRIAVTDGLTGLSTRRRFEEELTALIGRSSGVGVMLLDVDHFKQVNDVYGHQAGDAVLAELAHRLARSVRGGDLVARYGGEEFAVLLGSTDLATTAEIAERTRTAIGARPFVLDGGIELPITVSIGVAVWSGGPHTDGSQDSDDRRGSDGRRGPDRRRPTVGAPELLREADRRLYKAKADGRNLVVTA